MYPCNFTKPILEIKLATLFTLIHTMKKTTEIFDNENIARKKIEFNSRLLPEVNVWQVWRYYVWVNIWQEISKNIPYERPCLIFRKIVSSSLLMILPLSTKLHTRWQETSIQVNKPHRFWLKQSWILLHQIQIIDKKRLQNKFEGRTFGKGFIKLLNYKLFG